jgi:hypothetical protein
MSLLKVLTLSVVLFYSASIHAGDYVGKGTISVMQNAYGGWILKTNGTANNPDGCSKNIVILEGTHDQYKEVYGLLLSAYTAAKKVNIFVDGCHANGYKKLSFVYSDWNY